MGTVVVGAVVILLVVAAVKSLRKDKKNGKGICGGDCSSCKGCH